MVVLDFHATEFSVDLLEIEAARIKLAAEPVEHLLVKGRNGLKAALAVYLCAEHRNNPRDGCPLAALGSELARSDKRVRDVATSGFSRMVEILAAHFDQARPAEARKRAMATAAAMIGAVTMSRVLTDQKLSNSLLQAVEESITRA